MFRPNVSEQNRVLSRVRTVLEEHGTDVIGITYDQEREAVCVEYVGVSSDGAELLQDQLPAVVGQLTGALSDVGWLADVEQVIAVAHDPADELPESEPDGIWWRADAEWLRALTADGGDGDHEALEKIVRSTKAVYADGRAEDVEVSITNPE